jgi:hypothetical protein
MNRTNFVSILIGSAAALLLAGCSPSVYTPPADVPQAEIHAQTSVGGVLANWSNATVWGSAVPNGYACDSVENTPLYDPNCVTKFGPDRTDFNGNDVFGTDALPGTWDIAAEPDATCPAGATEGPVDISPPLPVQLTCGDKGQSPLNLGPSSCTIVYVNGQQQGYCPPILRATLATPTLPTSYPLSVGLYSDTASGEGGSSQMATSPTELDVPAPTAFGSTVVTVTDPQTNQVLGAAIFTMHECIIQRGPYGTTENCPY